MFVSLKFKLELKKEDKEKLFQLMCKQSSAIRMAYNMLKELEKEKTKNPHTQIYQRLRQLFPELPTRYIYSDIYKCLASSKGSPPLPFLGRIPPRDLSPLKPALVEWVWDRVRSRLVPLEAGDGPNKEFLEQPQSGRTLPKDLSP